MAATPARAKALADEIKRGGHAAPTFYQADLSSLAGARQLAEAVLADHKRLDVFVSNAGIGSQNGGAERQTSADGYELRFAVNYLSGFLLAYLLLPLLKAAAPSRIVNVASLGQHPIDFDDVMITKGYHRLARLCAEQAVADHVHHRSRRGTEGIGITVNSLHPATYMNTTMVRAGGITPISTVEQGGAGDPASRAPATTSPSKSGLFFNGMNEAQSQSAGL